MRSCATQFIAMREVARKVGVREQSLTLMAVLVEQRRLKTDGSDPSNSVSVAPFWF
jgi:hypothetical protein